MKQIHPFRRGGRRRLARITFAALAFLLAAAAFPAAAYAAEGEGESPALLQATTPDNTSEPPSVLEPLSEGSVEEGSSSEEEITPAALREAPFSVTVENEQSPSGELILGSSCQIGGVIRSESVMAKVFGGIYTVSGEKVIYHEVTPNAQSCNIAQSFDAVMAFGNLPVGEYVFRLEATDTEGQTVTAVSSPFTVVDGVIPSEIAFTGESVPSDTFPQGSGFSVRGVLASTYRLASVKGGVYHTDGTPTDVYYEDTPNKAVYDLVATFDMHLSFQGIPVGEYIYKIEATDVRGYSRTVVEKPFRVVAPEEAESDIHIYGASYPTGTIRQGKGFSVKGSIFSSLKLVRVEGGVYKAEGATCDYNDDFTYTFNPNKASFGMVNFDNVIGFGKLPVGEFVFRIVAEDEKGTTVELINSPFRIRSDENTEDSPGIVMKGVDVSAYQDDVDWEAVYADGIDFAILRAGVTFNGDANYREDRRFEEYYEQASAAGVKVGAYLYTSAINKSEMKADVEGLLATLEGKHFDMPIYIDVEAARQPNLGKAALTEIVKYGCELINAAGYKSGVYTSYNWFRDYVDTDVLSDTDCEIWLAFWPDNPDDFNFADFCVTWQYCSDGQVDGITGNVDKDYRYAALTVEKHAINVVQTEGGSLAADKEEAGCGERVTVTATPQAGYDLISVKYGDYEAAQMEDGSFAFSMPKDDVTVKAVFRAYAKTEAKAATCTEDGNTDYYTDAAGKLYTYADGVYTPVTKEDVTVKALGHDWDAESAVIDTENGTVTFTCLRDSGHTETQPLAPIAFTKDSQFTWLTCSADGMTVVVKNTDAAQDKLTFGCFRAVYVDGKALDEGAYTAEPGSVRVTLSRDTMAALATGKHKIKVELSYASIEHSFTVVEPDEGSPSTGESSAASTAAMVLLLLAAYGAAYAVSQKRRTAEAPAA